MNILYESMDFVNRKYACRIVSYVWMPNHIHFICYFEKQNCLIEYMRDFKKYTSFRIRSTFLQSAEALDQLRYLYREQKFKVWTDRFDDLYLFKRQTLYTKLNYIHANPVKKGLSGNPWTYKHSSAGFYLNGEVPLMPILHFEELL